MFLLQIVVQSQYLAISEIGDELLVIRAISQSKSKSSFTIVCSRASKNELSYKMRF